MFSLKPSVPRPEGLLPSYPACTRVVQFQDGEGGTVEGTSVTDADSTAYSASSVAEGPGDAGSVIMDGGFGSKRTPAQGVEIW